MMRTMPRLLRDEDDVALRRIKDRQIADFVVDRPFEDEPELGRRFVKVSLVFRIVLLRQAADDVRERAWVRDEWAGYAPAGGNRGVEVEKRAHLVVVARLAADPDLDELHSWY